MLDGVMLLWFLLTALLYIMLSGIGPSRALRVTHFPSALHLVDNRDYDEDENGRGHHTAGHRCGEPRTLSH
jgi:hypothetical protein